MLLRQMQEERETELLSPFAAKSAASRGAGTSHHPL